MASDEAFVGEETGELETEERDEAVGERKKGKRRER